MEIQTTDKRVIRTKNTIRKAFNELVQTKEMTEISVSELAQAANITRSTFYMYYDSVSAVRDQIENEIFAYIDKVMSEQDWVQCMINPYPLLNAIGREITKYDEYNRYILCSNNSGRLLDKVNGRVVTVFIKYAGDSKLDIDASRAKYVAAFVSAGICECFKIWYNHKSTLSLEELCRRISEIVTKGLAILKDIKFDS
ncbi:MAG: hypothetical protein NC037_02015 [Bacteroides sp.]|nr:hypothetical protein [Bacillota bacterium]MCM1393475.1 hypothetical protein [[Eubacterium] siraeum]MCM1455291.1 hypothetical protein [Bacteroides sp.]